MAGRIHALLYALWSVFEWARSKDNWSDGISRQGVHDRWYQAHEFRFHHVPVPFILLRLPYTIISHVVSTFAVRQFFCSCRLGVLLQLSVWRNAREFWGTDTTLQWPCDCNCRMLLYIFFPTPT